jgi:hypothetical protein
MKTITYKDLKAAIDDGRVHAIYDNRGPGSYNALHIEGAEQLSVSDVKERLPADHDAMLVFY